MWLDHRLGDAQTASSFPTDFIGLDKDNCETRRDEKHLSIGIWCVLYWEFYDTLNLGYVYVEDAHT